MQTQGKKATIIDIAKRAGVSPATVSRVLSNPDYSVRPELCARVREAAAQLNYRPNIFGRLLKGGSSREIGVIVPSITNPFYAELVSAVEQECMERGYTPIFCFSRNSPQLEARHLETLERKQVAGILLSCVHLTNEFLEDLSRRATTFVLFDQTHPQYEGDSVSFDFWGGGYLSTQYLLECGHRDIAFVSGPIDRYSRRQFFEGYKQALRDVGQRFNNRRVLLYDEADQDAGSEYDFHCGQELGKLLLKSEYLPDAVVTVNDMMAIGVIKMLEQEGIYVPADISVVGFDNIAISALVVPALTTIHQPATETGTIAARILLDRIEGEPVEQGKIILKPTLIERNSVRKVHKKIKR